MASNSPGIGVFARQHPQCCDSCKKGLACENTCHNHGVPGVDPAVPAEPMGPGPESVVALVPTVTVTQLTPAAPRPRPTNRRTPMPDHPSRQSPPPDNGYCGQVGSPYPCMPYVDPRTGKIPGAQLPLKDMGCGTYEEAVKRLCWNETTFRSPAPVAAGATMVFEFQVKWWWQIQSLLNLGDQANATFDLTNIGYGQSNYNLELHEFMIDNVAVPQGGIDVRRWNIEMFDKAYPMPAAGLNDPVRLSFTNVSAGAADIEIVAGGPSVLQIG